MKKIGLYSLVCLVLIGCGGGGSPATGGTIDPSDINLTKDIQDGKVSGYNSNDSIEDQYLAVINYVRSLKVKCNDPAAITGPSGKDMYWNPLLEDAAEEHSEDMKLSDHYAHDGSGTSNDITGQTFTPARASKFNERISRNGYTGAMTAENIAMSASKPGKQPANYWIKVMEGWMKSDHGHCSNIMNPQLTEFGMFESRADVNATGWYKVYWTQDFGGQ
ncbi:CAP domain-containing protein [Sulfurovum sp.]|uniref:CAP domain-containing protein n=1 Tax=Sulfurovum sp. TaxID=1969726 RepID=UPI0025DBB8F3|nr:CAP domain-containing protein [Sulfurovum sp.]